MRKDKSRKTEKKLRKQSQKNMQSQFQGESQRQSQGKSQENLIKDQTIETKKNMGIAERYRQLISNFRLSIVFRISLNYVKVFIVSAIGFLIWFIIAYCAIEGYQKTSKADTFQKEISPIINSIEEALLIEKTGTIYNKAEELKFYGIGIKIEDELKELILYDSTWIPNDFQTFAYKYRNQDKQFHFVTEYTKVIQTLEDKPVKLYYQYDFTDEYNKLMLYLIVLTIFYILFALRIHARSKKGTEKVLAPIKEMTKTASQLTANNLSERLNVAGTKNELKDLAIVINQMLNRIQTSYDSQKQFVSDASHELRTPIAVIQGYANLLDRWGLKDESVTKEAIEAIKNESLEMQALVEKLLFLARHDKKTLKLEKDYFDIQELIEDMIRETKLIVNDKEIIGEEIEHSIIHADKQAIKQGIRVFIDNAVKYTPQNGRITVLCKQEEKHCVITIKDSGMGMSKEDLMNIFNRFYRSDNARNENIVGHGLGLSIAKLIILGHGGKITVRSQLGEGSIFIITLPRVESNG